MGNVVPFRVRKEACAEIDEVAQLVGDADMAVRFDELTEKLQRVALILRKMSIEIRYRRERHFGRG